MRLLGHDTLASQHFGFRQSPAYFAPPSVLPGRVLSAAVSPPHQHLATPQAQQACVILQALLDGLTSVHSQHISISELPRITLP
jgi:hypothetical protein